MSTHVMININCQFVCIRYSIIVLIFVSVILRIVEVLLSSKRSVRLRSLRTVTEERGMEYLISLPVINTVFNIKKIFIPTPKTKDREKPLAPIYIPDYDFSESKINCIRENQSQKRPKTCAYILTILKQSAQKHSYFNQISLFKYTTKFHIIMICRRTSIFLEPFFCKPLS